MLFIVKTSCNVLREYGSSGEDVSVNAVIIPMNWVAILSKGRSPEDVYFFISNSKTAESWKH